MKLVVDGRTVVLRAGESAEVPAGVAHRQLPGDAHAGSVRVVIRPAGSTQRLLERLAELCRDGQITRLGMPRLVAGARLVTDFAADGHASRPSLRVQRAIALAVLRATGLMRPYAFVDEWDVAAPREAVFAALADARSYPDWWTPVYVDVDADGPAAIGHVSRQHFKGRLPYHLRTRSRIVELEAPALIAADVDGDLAGHGRWTLTPAPDGTHVRFDWTVHADRRLLKLLTPVLRPLRRWNHAWAIARAKEGLEPYARRAGAAQSA